MIYGLHPNMHRLTDTVPGWARRFVMADDLDADWKQDHSAIMPSLTKHLKKGGPSQHFSL